jgi:KDO2-lipid IV(A) lauroyltransferase
VAIAGVSPVYFLPRSLALRLGRTAGCAAYFCWPTARRAGLINLRRAFGPTLSLPQARRAARTVFGNLGQAVADGLQFSRAHGRGQPGWEQWYELEDPELAARLHADPRPKIFVTAHLGSWEIVPAVADLQDGRRSAIIVRRVDNPFLNRAVEWARFRRGVASIEKRGAALEALARLRRGEHVALLLDENAGPHGWFVDFFGRAASTSKLAALLSLSSGAPIVLATAVRRPDSPRLLYRLATLEPGAFRSHEHDAARALTQTITSLFEQWIRDAPLQWRWIHWRWKTRPDGTEESYRRRDLEQAFREPSQPLGS